MSALAALIDWRNALVSPELVQRMLRPVAWRGSPALPGWSGPHCSLAVAPRRLMRRQQGEVQPASDEQGSIVCVAEVRLDNRDELEKLLPGNTAESSDPELLVRGYQRWGNELARHLVGDFAFVIWDASRQEVYAARDPFGTCCLYYHASPDRLALGTEIEQLLTLPGVSHQVEPRLILDFLRDEYRHFRETFLRNIFRVLPGHWLRVGRGTWQEARYWHPPRKLLHFPHPDDYAQEFRRHLRRAVAARLDTDQPLIAQLSGGLDSTSIVCLADEIYRRDGGNRPPLWTASALYPGLDCDESPLIEAVVEKVRFRSERWNGSAAAGLEPEFFSPAHPWGGGVPKGAESDFGIAQKKEAAVILSGLGGDELLFERGVFRDLAASGRWLTLWRQTALAPRYATHTQGFFLKDAIRGACPGGLRRLFRWFRPAAVEPPPPWLGTELRPLWKETAPAPADIEAEAESCSSHTQRYTWKWLTGPRLLWTTEVQVLQAAYQGLEMRFPFLDAALAQFVLAIPFKYRLPGGRMKGLLRDAMRGILPTSIRERRGVTTFTTHTRAQLLEELSRLQTLVNGKTWRSEPFVLQRGARMLLNQLENSSPNDLPWPTVKCLSEIALLECWFRRME